MNAPDPVPPGAIPWYKSKILQGVVAGLVAQLVARMQRWGFTVLPGVDQWLVQTIMDLIALGAIAWTTRARVTQKTAPALTLTKKGAEKVTGEKSDGPANAPATEPPPPCP